MVRGKGVRSRMAQMMGKPCKARDRVGRSAQPFIEDFDIEIAGDARPVGHGEGHVLVVVENGAAQFRHGGSVSVGPQAVS